MKTGEYYHRIADTALSEILKGKGAVLIEGAKWCGKTTTGEQMAKTLLYMDKPAQRDRNLTLAKIDPDRLLTGEHPILVDEWQIAPTLWDTIRCNVDHLSGYGHYILTGSSVPPSTDEIHHTGTGRITRYRMRPMSLWESRESSGGVSLGALFNGATFATADAKSHTLEETAFLACRGGWPEAIFLQGKTALRQAFDYVDAIAESDISRYDGVSRDANRTRRLLRSYARLQGTQAALSQISADLSAHDGDLIGENTLYSYLNALRGIFVIEDMVAWHPSLRRKTTIRTSDTRYFADPSIMAASLRIGPDDYMDDLATFGFAFEAMAVRDLRVYADALDGDVFHYLDRNGTECDAVLHLRNGRYGLIEIKLGGAELVEAGCASLRKVESILDTTHMRRPSFRMVITAVGEFAYTRPEDGIVVCPLSALRP